MRHIPTPDSAPGERAAGDVFASSNGYLPSLSKAGVSGAREASQRSEGSGNPVKTWHVVAVSGGKDSTALALRLAEIEPRDDYVYVCTPTGDELPEMFEWWKQLGVMLGKQIKPIMELSLAECIEQNKALPNFRMRFCTRQIKIEPYRRFLQRLTATGPFGGGNKGFYSVVSYVGLRADEEGRAGGAYDDIPGITMRFPLREWGWGLKEVQDYLAERGVTIPKRTDCARCYHQRIGEWYDLWTNYPEIWADAERDEARMSATFRSPGRDTWPVALKDLRAEFESGRKPLERKKRDTMSAGGCRVCAM
jgi:3'-phosphoadenosine 5'-phosphosulfate sulfotransferase (PAPS reductase)/FAD synthetase